MSEDEAFEIMKNMSDTELSKLRLISNDYKQLVDKFLCIYALNDWHGTNCYARYRDLKIRAHTIVMIDAIRNGELPTQYRMNIGSLYRDIDVFKMPVNLNYVDGRSILVELIRYSNPENGEYFETILKNPHNIGSIGNLSSDDQRLIAEWEDFGFWYTPHSPIYGDEI